MLAPAWMLRSFIFWLSSVLKHENPEVHWLSIVDQLEHGGIDPFFLLQHLLDLIELQLMLSVQYRRVILDVEIDLPSRHCLYDDLHL